jgi:hypothetical protein
LVWHRDPAISKVPSTPKDPLIDGSNLAFVGVYLVAGSVQASRRIHEGVLARLFDANVYLFDLQPLGRITTLLSVYIEGINFRLINAADGLILTAYSLLASTIFLAMSSPYLILALLPIGYMTSRIQLLYGVYAFCLLTFVPVSLELLT